LRTLPGTIGLSSEKSEKQAHLSRLCDAKCVASTDHNPGLIARDDPVWRATTLALSLGTILSGALLVEIVFGYAGMGAVLFKAVTAFDYFTIYGVVFFIIVGVAFATLVLVLTYPLLDPRFRYQKNW